MKYLINPSIPSVFKVGDKFSAHSTQYALVFTGKMYLLNLETFQWYGSEDGGESTRINFSTLLHMLTYAPRDLESLKQWKVEVNRVYIPLVIESVEYKYIAEFVYDKNSGYRYGGGNDVEWRKLGVIGEDSKYIWGYDFVRNAERKFCKDKIVGGKIIKSKE